MPLPRRPDLRPGGFFDFTFNRTEGRERNVLREDFYYRTQTLLDLADRCGLDAEFMTDWEALGPSASRRSGSARD